MAATIAYCIGFNKQGYAQASQASRLGYGSASASANTWQTFTTCHVNADGSGYVSVARDGKTIHHHTFEAEG